MKQTKRIGVFLVGAMALAACGGGGSIAIGDLGDEIIAAQCARYVRCGVYASEELCRAAASADLSALEQGVEAGRIRYDGEAARECLDALAEASCDTTTASARKTPGACDEAIVGTVADGGACYNSNECVSGSCNEPDTCNMACCAGTCDPTVVEVAIGQSCANAPCVEDAFCNDQDVCAALLAANAACQSDTQCGYGLMCANDVCVASANRGEACADGDCADLGDRCDGTNCVALSAVGGTCSSGFAGLFDCQRPYVCNQTTLKCEEPPTAGESCQFFCAGGLFCNDDNECEAPRANGAACTGNSECESNYCDETGASPVCADRPVCG